MKKNIIGGNLFCEGFNRSQNKWIPVFILHLLCLRDRLPL